jgi:hypothetical protein
MSTPTNVGPYRRPWTMATLWLLLIGVLVMRQPAKLWAQVAIVEPFASATTHDPNWSLIGSASLTGEGDGWLQLTPNATHQTGAAILDTPFSSAAPFVIRFEYAVYGQDMASGGEGFSVFLFDGSQTSGVGAGGDCLGYSSGPICCPATGSRAPM